jgi:hypothetical protein
MNIDNSITRLRLCGSKNASNFLKAFSYYPLWNLSKGAKYLLRKEIQNAGVKDLLIGRRLTRQKAGSIINNQHLSSTSKSDEEEGHYDRMTDNI